MVASGHKQDATLQEHLQRELKRLRQEGSNSQCADCSDTDTRFASVTLGIFLCNRCFGIHRALGAHLTRAKVLTLDAWSEAEVAHLAAVGQPALPGTAALRPPPPGPERIGPGGGALQPAEVRGATLVQRPCKGRRAAGPGEDGGSAFKHARRLCERKHGLHSSRRCSSCSVRRPARPALFGA